MKHLIPKRRWAALLILGVTLASVASAAVAGGYYGQRRSRAGASCETPRVSASFSWRSGGGDFRPAVFGGYAVRDRGYDRGYGRGYYASGPVREEACSVSHPPHAWFNNQLWCSGKNADGSWRGPWHCEDEFGRKKVNLVGFDPNCEKWVR